MSSGDQCEEDEIGDTSQSTIFKKSGFAKPQRLSGIHAVEINAAREMTKIHTRSRQPSRGTGNVSEESMVRNLKGSGQFKKSTNIPKTSGGLGPEPAPGPGPGSGSGSGLNNSTVTVPAKAHEGQCKNPQCYHCGLVIIPSPQSFFPIEDKPSITVKDWSIYTIKQPILSSPELDQLDTRYNFPLPEMIFGNNVVRLVNDKTGEKIEFKALEALDTLDDNCTLKVSYHEEWLQSRKAKDENQSTIEQKQDIKYLTEVDTLKPYDWTYSVNYKGSCTNLDFEPTDVELPIDKLLKPDPILFFDESILFEDELADNGISMLSTKIRVMPSCLLLLCRFFLRIDNVIFRIRDVRLFIDFDTNQILREYKEQEHPYDDLLNQIKTNKSFNDPKKLLRDPNWVSQNIPIIKKIVETPRKKS